MTSRRFRMTVGDRRCDIHGFTHHHIQAAVDRAALLGGGEVVLSRGVFRMGDALHMRSGVSVRGQGPETVLLKNPMKTARITCFLGYGHNDIEVDQPDLFEPGEGVHIRDDHSTGFYNTVATLVHREGNVWYTNRPHHHDYLARHGARIETLFPIVAAEGIHDATIEDLRIEGNRRQNPVFSNPCRACAFLALNAHCITVRRLIVRDFNGDGFGFQTCDDFLGEECVVEHCTGNGFHPGSGSNRFILRRCISRRNGGCGLFYCLRVRHGLVEECRFESNGSHGLSVGERDTDSVNRRLVIRLNGGAGFYIRACDRANAAHRTRLEDSLLEQNVRKPGEEPLAELVFQGETEGLAAVGNTIRRRPGVPALRATASCAPFEWRENRIRPEGVDALQIETAGQ